MFTQTLIPHEFSYWSKGLGTYVQNILWYYAYDRVLPNLVLFEGHVHVSMGRATRTVAHFSVTRDMLAGFMFVIKRRRGKTQQKVPRS